MKKNYIRKRLLAILLSVGAILTSNKVYAQFSIDEPFKNTTTNNQIVFGDDARLTSGIEDPVGAGWLRLTPDETSRKGFAYINTPMPSNLGVLVDVEYKSWRRVADSYNGADGITVFLFDADYGPANDPNSTQLFKMGAYGGSLGYANFNTVGSSYNGPGLSGGYIGVGLDEYGNYGAGNEGRNGGAATRRPNAIIVRGRTTSTSQSDPNTNTYRAGVSIAPNGSGGWNLYNALTYTNGSDLQNVIDYNTAVSSRPSNNAFYRRIQVTIKPLNTQPASYQITVKWATTVGGALQQLIQYTTTDPVPQNVKIGFAASTGGGVNIHEIRNLKVTTLGDVRIQKFVTENQVEATPGQSGTANELHYSIHVTNDTPITVSNNAFIDQLKDANGNNIPAGMFDITNITATGFASGTTLPSPSVANPISSGSFTGNLNLAGNSTGIINVTGRLKAKPTGNVLQNTASITPPNGLADDPTNNISTVSTPVIQTTCFDDPKTGNTNTGTKVGITLLKRAGDAPQQGDNWPKVRMSGHIALESNTQGFVLTRMTTTEINAISNPQEGMMTYDTVAKCLKIYSDGSWKCFNTPACP